MRFVYSLFVIGLAACQAQDPRVADLTTRLDKAEKRIEALEKRPAAAQQPARKRPDQNVVYNVPVGDGDLIRGKKVAKVTIVEGFDFACPYCARSRPIVKEILAKNPENVRVVSKQYVVHPDTAALPAFAVCAGARQGKAAEVEDAIWAAAWPEAEPGKPRFEVKNLAMESLEKVATDLKLDVTKFKADMAATECKQWVAKQQGELTAIGVNGTPAFYVNGRPYNGPRTVEAFSAFVDEELKKADEAVAKGTKVEEYYSSLMKSAQRAL